jgi:hypothetical protein
MTTTQLKRRVAQRLRKLSPERLKVADEFLAFLQNREDNAATAELLSIPGFKASFRRGMKQVAAGKMVPFAKVRHDV